MMTAQFVGNKAIFAVESGITEAYERLGARALGYFIFHIAGKSYGVKAPDATLLAVPFDEVARQIKRRGEHCASFGNEKDAVKIARSCLEAVYSLSQKDEFCFGLSFEELQNIIYSKRLDWGPHADEAFDDGSHIYQFDIDDKVRLIGCKNLENTEEFSESVEEVWLDADQFYGILEKWKNEFDAAWHVAPKLSL